MATNCSLDAQSVEQGSTQQASSIKHQASSIKGDVSPLHAVHRNKHKQCLGSPA
ncbi:hypothetical protein MHM98_17975 [Psychrobium sp. MM17-31]|uniref:hypothetical protein n=1 Tax=Psychrobium sp. MM17-31 TaxID=2917758 RepID=UPI001EF47C96|nr:hypothetical protein [Psychrobium sp. MM17-31]MCG7533219.1 hypothetical protein [Psychrobium sp. MM17-31]